MTLVYVQYVFRLHLVALVKLGVALQCVAEGPRSDRCADVCVCAGVCTGLQSAIVVKERELPPCGAF